MTGMENNTLWLSIFIIVGLPLLFWLGGWVFVKLWRDPQIGRSHSCPHCRRQGPITLFGAFECVACRQVFYVNERGRDVPSLRQALLTPLVVGLVFGLLLIGIDIHLAHSWWNSGFYWIQVLLQMAYGISKKKFPAQV